MRVALDTNILAYAQGVNGDAMKKAALALIGGLPAGAVVLPAQVIAELFQVLIRKGQLTPVHARAAILSWCNVFPVAETSLSVLLGAAELAVSHRFSFWDGMVLTSANEAGCRLLLSEDLQPGFTWNSVTVANPFAPSKHPLLQNLLSSQP
ncbi:MAG TPA: PIN domain-containing protein [Candidatus Acidoferrum sp.]|nr:PIN domain-containing protein [Candidatus Acidoferrum sp.]